MSQPSIQINVNGQPAPLSADALEALALEQAQGGAQPGAQTVAVPEVCTVTVFRTGKNGNQALEVDVGTTIAEVMRLCEFDVNNITFKKQTDGGVITEAKSDTRLGKGNHNVWASPRVVGGR